MEFSLSPNTFDPSEFPSLGNRDNSAPNPSLSARPNYGEKHVPSDTMEIGTRIDRARRIHHADRILKQLNIEAKKPIS
ncbi:Uncharacterized protein FKW44_019366 [Caligus rogercresseyi]|uniref:Uncharacterized protein n=1 Tax=Caligus rogercresseyi TaxID=217165 RepID=A0A7T8JXG6_CALRO|nr:Uncharacterized protein FKW44_019366 [Caligus rogercresseyi]